MNSERAEAIDQLCEDLIENGFTVGRATSGNVLRVDSRTCQDPVNIETVVQIVKLSTLRELYLRGLAGINEFAAQISGLTKLRVLDVESSDFSDESLQALCTMEQLEMINLRDTRVTPPMVAALRKKMIRTRIIGP